MSLEERYRTIHSGGLSKLVSGDILFWNGLPESDWYKPIVAAKMHVSDTIQDLIDSIASIARSTGVEIALAGRDFPLHVTLKQGKVDMLGVGVDHSLPALTLIGEMWKFEHLALGPNTILGSETASETVHPVRALLNEVFTTAGLEPVPLDIVHATIAWVMYHMNVADLMRYTERLLLRSEVAAMPLMLKVESIYWGTIGDLLKSAYSSSNNNTRPLSTSLRGGFLFC